MRPLVIGVPTVKRNYTSYLSSTLLSLVSSMDDLEKSLVLIIVMIAEPDDENYVINVSKTIQSQFSAELRSGLLEIIAVPKQFYPDLESLSHEPNRLDDNAQRYKWRVKQVLDLIYLMTFAASRGKYYLQLEDDVLSREGFVSTILLDIISKADRKWLQLYYSNAGFIGKLFRSSDLPNFVEFCLTFYKDKPVDWILIDYLQIKICRPDESSHFCHQKIQRKNIQFLPELFLHVGRLSSLHKKSHKFLYGNNNIKDPFFVGFENPPVASFSTSLKTFKGHTIRRAYFGKSKFWARQPHAGDYIHIKFKEKIILQWYFFMSGDDASPSDIIQNTTLEIKLQDSSSAVKKGFQINADGFLVLSKFASDGICQGTVPDELNPITELQVRFHSELPNWVLLNEIFLKTR